MTRRLLLLLAILIPPLALSTPASAGGRASTRPLKGTVVVLETNYGDIHVRLFRKRAPITTANFLRYVRKGHYNGTIFHRVIGNFMIQGGGYTRSLQKKPTAAPIKNEADNGLSNTRGTIAMARTAAPHSATAQFFINVKDNSRLDYRSKTKYGWGYCVFGKVIRGMDVVDKIRWVRTTRQGMHANMPVTPVVIKRARVLR